MLKLMSLIFLLPISQLVAMEAAGGNVTIGIANSSNQGVMVHITKAARPVLLRRSLSMANLDADRQRVMCQALMRRKLTDSAHNIKEKEPEAQVWVRRTTVGRIHVSPPHSPSIKHVLVVKDSDDNQTLAQTVFDHPEENIIFCVRNKEITGFVVKRVTADDLPNYGPQSTGSKLDLIFKK